MNSANVSDIFSGQCRLITLFGRSGSGKTTLMKRLIKESRDIFSHVFIFQGSKPSEDNVYTDVTWPDNISVLNMSDTKTGIENLKQEINALAEFGSNINKSIIDKNKINQNTKDPLLHFLIVIDDLTDNTNKIKDMVGKIRHNPITIVLLLQKATHIDKSFRSGVDMYIINVNFELHLLADESDKMKQDFMKMVDMKTNDRLFFVYNTHSNKSNFIEVNETQLLDLKNDTPPVFFQNSKQRHYMVKYLKEIAKDLLKG